MNGLVGLLMLFLFNREGVYKISKMASSSSFFSQRFGGSSVPLILSPMANAGGKRLAIAVAQAGAVPSLPAAAMSAEDLEIAVLAVRSATGGVEPFVNFFAHRSFPRSRHEDAKWLRALSPLYKTIGVEDCTGELSSSSVSSSSSSDHHYHTNLDRASGRLVLPPWFRRTVGRQPFSEDHLALIEKLKLRRISFHFGIHVVVEGTANSSSSSSLHDVYQHPQELVPLFRRTLDRIREAAGHNKEPVVIACTATTVAEAKVLCDSGIDVLVAQGLEAGGHRGQFLLHEPRHHQQHSLEGQHTTLELLRHIHRSEVLGSTPIQQRPLLIAAGGISTDKEVAAMLHSPSSTPHAVLPGADGVQVGTAFLNTVESDISPLYRRRLQTDATLHPSHHNKATIITRCFTGRNARALRNSATEFCSQQGFDDCFVTSEERGGGDGIRSKVDVVPNFPNAVDGWSHLRYHWERKGSWEFTPMLCGSGIHHHVGSPKTVQDVVKGLFPSA